MSEEIQNDEAVVEEVETVVEQSAGAATLGKKATKAEMLSSVMKHFAHMTKQDLSSFLDKTLAQVGNEPTKDTSSQNQNSIDTKPSNAVKEDLEEIFGETEELSEEFRTKASTLFEAAVSNRVVVEVARIEEQYEQKLEEEVTTAIDELHEQVSKYMDYVVEKWMEENSVAIESHYRTEATENFIASLKDLFVENYVEVPEEKIDLLGEYEAYMEELEEALNASEAEKVRLNALIEQSEIQDKFDEISEGLADTQVEKLRSLSEGVEFSSIEEYAEKLDIIKNQYFTESNVQKTETGLLAEETAIGMNDLQEETEAVVPVEMRDYVAAISKTLRK